MAAVRPPALLRRSLTNFRAERSFSRMEAPAARLSVRRIGGNGSSGPICRWVVVDVLEESSVSVL
jgi:hypothetical protein